MGEIDAFTRLRKNIHERERLRVNKGKSRPLVILVGYRDSRLAGGSLRVLETLAKSLPEEGFDVEIMFAYGDAGGVSAACRCPIHFVRAKSAFDFSAWSRARRIINRRKPDILQFVDNVNWLLICLMRSGVHTLTYAHGRTRGGLKTWILSKMQHNLADSVIAISHGAKNSLVERVVVSAERVWVVQNGVDCRFGNELASRPRPKRFAAGQDVTLGMACRITINKGILDAVDLMRLLPVNWKLNIVGDGPDIAQLEEKIFVENMQDRVVIAGSLEYMEDFYRNIDYYLFLSRYEAFGLTLVESMSIGLPVVGLQAEGEYAELECPLIDSDVALLLARFHPFDVRRPPLISELALLASELQKFHSDAGRRESMIEMARQRVQSGFLASHQAAKLARVYREVLVD